MYAPRDFPTYEQEPDARFERDQLTPAIHQGQPARPRWVPQVEHHPGPPYRSLPKIGGCTVVGVDWASDTPQHVRDQFEALSLALKGSR
jgi:hypothetical protein